MVGKDKREKEIVCGDEWILKRLTNFRIFLRKMEKNSDFPKGVWYNLKKG